MLILDEINSAQIPAEFFTWVWGEITVLLPAGCSIEKEVPKLIGEFIYKHGLERDENITPAFRLALVGRIWAVQTMLDKLPWDLFTPVPGSKAGTLARSVLITAATMPLQADADGAAYFDLPGFIESARALSALDSSGGKNPSA